MLELLEFIKESVKDLSSQNYEDLILIEQDIVNNIDQELKKIRKL